MKMSANQFRQESYNGIEFISDCRNGAIQWASYGSDTVGYSPLVRGGLEAKDGGLLDLIILWILGFKFGVADCVNDLCQRIAPIIKSSIRKIRGWWATDDISNLQTDIWMCMSGLKRATPFDPQKGGLSTYIHYRCLAYICDINRRKKLARRLLGLGAILDDDTPKSSIGDSGLLGLVYEDPDPDTIRNKWTKLSPKKDGILESVVKTENEVAIERILSRIDPVDREMLEMNLLDGISCQDIRDSLEFRKLRTYKSMNGVRKHILATVNRLRQKFQPGAPPILGLKGRHGRVSIMEEIETD